MRPRLTHRLLTWLDEALTQAGQAFMDAWGRLERGYRRPAARLALRLRFAFYPLLALSAIAWLAWDYGHGRSLDAAEDAIFDRVIHWRPLDPPAPSGIVVVEIDDCSIDHFRARGEGGWPWSRQRHADLLDALDRAGVRAVGYDVIFADPAPGDPAGDAALEAMAAGAGGRFLFGSSRMPEDFDTGSPLRAAQAPGAFPLRPGATPPGPPVALMLPYGQALARHSALTNVARNQDGVLRDVPLYEALGDWALPSLPLRLAVQVTGRTPQSFPASVRINWRTRSRLPYVSAADLIEGRAVCRALGEPLPPLRGATVLVGYTAAGLTDTKPTPIGPATPGVEVLAEATGALIHDSAIRVPPTGLKYLLAALLVALSAFAFWRGEPHQDIDAVFVAGNLLLLAAAYAGLSFFGWFFDIFACVGFVSLCFGVCRMYAAVQRGHAVGNNDYRPEYDPDTHPWLVMARLRFAADPGVDPRTATLARREYRRLLRRFLYAGSEAVMIEGVVERKSWLHGILDDLVLLVWKGKDEHSARAIAETELDALHAVLNAHDQRLDDDGKVYVCAVAAEIDDRNDDSTRGERLRLRELLGRDLNEPHEWPLSASNPLIRK